MADEPPGRDAGYDHKPRPDLTLIIPGRPRVEPIIDALLGANESFTVDPSPTQKGVWHVGVHEACLPVVYAALSDAGFL